MTTDAARTLRVEQIWGTAVGIDVRDPVAVTVLDAAFDWFGYVDDGSTARPPVGAQAPSTASAERFGAIPGVQ